MHSTTTEKTIDILHTWFARFGLVYEIVSDNGPQFTSESFQQFCTKYGIRHIRSSVYHSATNGLAERLIQSLKSSLKCQKSDNMSIQKKVSKFLFAYRNTPHATTNEIPAQLMFGRRLRNKLDIMKPDLRKYVQGKQYSSEKTERLERNFSEGEKVIVRDYRQNSNTWQPAQIMQQTGPVSYRVRVDNNNEWRRHADQIRHSSADTQTDNQQGTEEINTPLIEQPASENSNTPVIQTPESRRSTRIRKAVDRYGQSVPYT